MRSADNIIAEIEMLIKNYGIRQIRIVDDNFTVYRKRVIDFCKKILEKNIDINLEFPSGVYLPTIDREVLIWLKRIGLKEIYFAIENGNQEFLSKVIKKNVNLNQAKKLITISKELGLKTNSYFILGYPGETKKTMAETIRFAYESGLDRARLHIYQPFPHTPIYDFALKHGYISPCINLGTLRMRSFNPQVKTESFAPKDVLDMQDIAAKIFRERNLSKYEGALKEIIERPVD